MIVVSWQARLHLNKRVKFYSLFLGNLELGRIHIKQITRSEILRQYRKIALRVIFISYQSIELPAQKSEHRQSIGIHLYYCANF